LNKIFVVDDEKYYLNSLNRILHNIYELKCFSDGEELLNYFDENTMLPDLILLDIMMPKMNGYDICRELKTNEKTKDIPIIFVSGLDSFDDEARGIEFGVEDYIYKPYNTEVLKARMANVIRLSKHRKNQKHNNFSNLGKKMIKIWLGKMSDDDENIINKTLFEAYWMGKLVFEVTGSKNEQEEAYYLKVNEIVRKEYQDYSIEIQTKIDKYNEDILEHWDGSGKVSLKKNNVNLISRVKDVVETYADVFYDCYDLKKGIDYCVELRGTTLDPEITDLFVDLIKKDENVD
jgi:response regulator RpfG family c-di-GMP phosphodiesterase